MIARQWFETSNLMQLCQIQIVSETRNQARRTVATRLSFWHLFDKLFISLMASGCTTIHTNNLWNVQFQPVLQTQKTFLVRKVKVWPNFCRHKIYLSPVDLGIIARATRCLKPFQTQTVEDESCNGWYPAFHFSWHLIGSLKQPEALKLIKAESKTCQKLIKNLSKRCQKLCWVAMVAGVCKIHIVRHNKSTPLEPSRATTVRHGKPCSAK